MVFFSILPDSLSDVEQKLEKTYISMFVAGKGISRSEARKTVRDLIQQAKEESEKEGTSKLPPNFGDILIDSGENDLKLKMMLSKRRKEGVEDEDIRWWWNMHDLERRMLAKEDEASKVVLFINHLQKSGNPEKAAASVKKYFPIYGDTDDTATSSGDDRPLPYELKNKISMYIQNRSNSNAGDFKKDIEKSSSFNALIRREIINNKLSKNDKIEVENNNICPHCKYIITISDKDFISDTGRCPKCGLTIL